MYKSEVTIYKKKLMAIFSLLALISAFLVIFSSPLNVTSSQEKTTENKYTVDTAEIVLKDGSGYSDITSYESHNIKYIKIIDTDGESHKIKAQKDFKLRKLMSSPITKGVEVKEVSGGKTFYSQRVKVPFLFSTKTKDLSFEDSFKYKVNKKTINDEQKVTIKITGDKTKDNDTFYMNRSGLSYEQGGEKKVRKEDD